MKTNKEPVRHGDVWLVPCEKREDVKIGDNIKVALGEETGHYHMLKGNNIKYQGNDGNVSYVELDNSVFFFHQEHKPNDKWDCLVPPGSYEVVIQEEYDYFENELKKVVD
jgi:hypothetical protein